MRWLLSYTVILTERLSASEHVTDVLVASALVIVRDRAAFVVHITISSHDEGELEYFLGTAVALDTSNELSRDESNESTHFPPAIQEYGIHCEGSLEQVLAQYYPQIKSGSRLQRAVADTLAELQDETMAVKRIQNVLTLKKGRAGPLEAEKRKKVSMTRKIGTLP